MPEEGAANKAGCLEVKDMEILEEGCSLCDFSGADEEAKEVQLTKARLRLKSEDPKVLIAEPLSSSLFVVAEEETEEELLAKLGVRLEAQVAALASGEGGGFNDDIARCWGAQEQARPPRSHRSSNKPTPCSP